MVINDSGVRVSRSSTTMSNPASSNAAVGNAPSIADDSASTITVNTKTRANFPPPTTDKPRPHVCGTFQRSFSRLEHLKRHERSHTKEKPFECPECARCFARRDLQLRHQQKLHQTSTPSSRPRKRRESTTGVRPGQSRTRKNSVAGPNPANTPNAATINMRPRVNTISHVDGSAMQMMAAANASVARGIPPTHTHSRHPSLAGLPIHNLDHIFGGMSAAMGPRGMQPDLPKVETGTLGNLDFNGLRTKPPMAAFNNEFDFEGYLFGPNHTVNPNLLHYNDSPQSMAVEQSPSFAQSINDMSSNQALDDNFD